MFIEIAFLSVKLD